MAPAGMPGWQSRAALRHSFFALPSSVGGEVSIALGAVLPIRLVMLHGLKDRQVFHTTASCSSWRTPSG